MNPGGLIEAIFALEDVLDRLNLRRSYGGAVAYNFYGPPRLTMDVDVLLLASDLGLPGLIESLADAGYLHGFDPPKPIQVASVLEEFRSKGRFAAFLWGRVPVEVFLPWHPFHHRVLDRSPDRLLEERRIRIHAAEDLILIKKMFDRPKDIADIRAIALARRGRLDLAQIRSEAKEVLPPDSASELEALLAVT